MLPRLSGKAINLFYYHFYKLKVGDFSRWLQGRDITDVTAITSTDIKRYLVHLQERGLNDTSQHDYARAVKTFLNYCVRDELLDRSPFDKVKMPQQEQRLPVVLTDDEVRRALHMVKPQRNRLIVRFILDSGVRAAELLALNVGDIEMATGVVVVRLGKQQKERLTAIGGRTRKEVKRYLIERGHPSSHEPLIASTTTGARLSMPGLMGAFRKMQGQTGIDHLTAHALRRTQWQPGQWRMAQTNIFLPGCWATVIPVDAEALCCGEPAHGGRGRGTVLSSR
ncbi:MAG: tyrosine-type recombinase/integrase [Caldilineaceae bacterium]